MLEVVNGHYFRCKSSIVILVGDFFRGCLNLDFAMNWFNFPQMINQDAIDEMFVWVLYEKKNQCKVYVL